MFEKIFDQMDHFFRKEASLLFNFDKILPPRISF